MDPRKITTAIVLFISMITCLCASGEESAGEKTRANIVVVNGIDYRDYLIKESLSNYQAGKVLYHDIKLDVNLLPKVTARPVDIITADELKTAGLFVMTNAPAPAIAPETRQLLKAHINDGMSLLIMGGLFSLGKGQYVGTELEEIAPVDVKDKWDVKKLDKALAIKPAQGVVFSSDIKWEQLPSVLFYHDVKLKEGDEVWLRAGNIPVLVVRKQGKGRTAAWLSAPLGIAPEGVLPYWQWESYPKLMAEIAHKLLDHSK
jgi:uncharacterized membrane protein